MSPLSTNDAAERLAKNIEIAGPAALAEIYSELFPDKPSASSPSAKDLARHVRSGLKAEELVDLWNVVFPADWNVWYDEEAKQIHYNEDAPGYAETD